MTQAPIGAVAALRECSVVFAAIVGVAFLGEPFRSTRAGVALLIGSGCGSLEEHRTSGSTRNISPQERA
jgi:hypothetical protein